MKKIYFTGYYGMKNYGDDLFGAICFAYLSRQKNIKTFISGPNINGVAMNCTVSDVFKNAYSRSDWIGSFVRLVNSMLSKIKADEYVYAGGSLFSSEVKGVRKVVDRYKKSSISAIGVSVGPFSSKYVENQVSEYLSSFKYISVRDEESFDLIKGMNLDCLINKSTDLAGLISYLPFYNSLEVIKQKNNRSKIGFTPCSWGEGSSESLDFCNEFISSIIKLRDEFDLDVEILVLNDNSDDLYYAKHVLKQLHLNGIASNIKSYIDLGLENTFTEISSFDLYISARLHGGITAYMLSTKFILFNYHQKCENFCKDIGYDASLLGSKLSLYEKMNFLLVNDLNIEKDREQYSLDAENNFINAPWFK